MNDSQKGKERRHQFSPLFLFFFFNVPDNKKMGSDSTKDLAVGRGVDFSGRRERFHLPDCSKA